MAVRAHRAQDRRDAAWKNGGGVTREVAAGPPGAELVDFDWRLSFADVAQGGPFSVFPGIDRIITLVDGAGMELDVDGTRHRVDEPGRPFAFPGDAPTGCRLLDGPIVDFNVMTRRGRTTATVDIVPDGLTLPAPDASTVLVVALTGRARLALTDEPDIALDRLDAVELTGSSITRFRTDGAVAVVTLT